MKLIKMPIKHTRTGVARLELELEQGNLVMLVPTEDIPKVILGSGEQIQKLRSVSGWRFDHEAVKRNESPALLAHIDTDLMISVVKRAFPGIEIVVEMFDYAQWDDEHPERTPEEIDDEFDLWLHSQ